MRSDVPASRLGGTPGEERQIAPWASGRLILAHRTPVPARDPLFAIPPQAGSPSPAEAPSCYPSEEKRGNGRNSEETPGNHGEIAYPQDRNGQGNGEGRRTAPPGLPPRARPAPLHNPSRARIGPSAGSRASRPALQAPRSPLPRAADSLPRAVRPVETPLPWPQGHIPATRYFPAPLRPHCYRTTDWRSGEPVTAGRVVGAMRGWDQKPNDLSDDHPSAPTSAPRSASAIC